MRKSKDISAADLRLWAEYAQQVRLLPGRARLAFEAEPAAVPVEPKAVARTPPVPPSTPINVNHPPPGLDRASWERFRTGRAKPARSLDLHGMTAAQAHLAVLGFLQRAHAAQIRVVEIITGKGQVLLPELPHWLNAPSVRPLILALAHPHAANTGAVRILLRRARHGPVRR